MTNTGTVESFYDEHGYRGVYSSSSVVLERPVLFDIIKVRNIFESTKFILNKMKIFFLWLLLIVCTIYKLYFVSLSYNNLKFIL